jgi:hypothetical protein
VGALVRNPGKHTRHKPCIPGGSLGTFVVDPQQHGIGGRRRIDILATVALQRGTRRIRMLARMIRSDWRVEQRRNE